MSRYFRWQGLAGFSAVLIIILAIVYLLAGQFIKWGIETGLGWQLGAEVNVANVEVDWSPFTIHVHDLQATDPEKPTHNLVSFSYASAGADFWQYLFGKTIIEQLTVEGLAINSVRQSAGQVYRSTNKPDKKNSSTESNFPAITQDLPSVEDLLKNSDLRTPKAAKALEVAYKEEREKLKQLKQELPTETQLKEYEKQVKAITKSKVKTIADVTKLKNDLAELKRQFKLDKAKLKTAKNQFNDSKERLATAVNTLKDAPEQDWQDVKTKYQLDKIDSADFAHILFGEQAREYYEIASLILEKVKPLLGSQQGDTEVIIETSPNGRFIHFAEQAPLPSWLIKHAKIEVKLAQGDMAIELKELTAQHWLRNKASEWFATSSNIFGVGVLKASGSLFINQQQTITSDGLWKLELLEVPATPIRDSKSLSITLTQSELHGNGNYSFKNNKISSKNQLNISHAKFTGQANTSIGNSVVDTLKTVSNFDIQVTAKGALSSPELKVNSNLNQILMQVLQRQLTKKLGNYQQKFSSRLLQQQRDSINGHQQDEADLQAFEHLLTDTDDALSSLLKSKLADGEKEKLEQKLEKKLKKKLSKLFG